MNKFLIFITAFALASFPNANAGSIIVAPNLNQNITGSFISPGHYGLDVNGSFTATSNFSAATGSAVPTFASYTGVNNGSGLLVGISYGQALMAASLPVTLSSNQSALAVSQSGTWTTGRTWSLLNTTDSVNSVQSGTWNLTNISGTITLPTGASTSALQTTGNTTLSTISGQLPTTLGAKTTANSVAVNIASDQTVTTTDAVDGSPTGGAAGTKSALAGGIFNTSLPVLTTGQQAGLQLDSSGRLINGTSAATIGAVGVNAGANIIGKVGIDQTTPGTTNGVQVNAALPTGTNTIGSVKITDGTNIPGVAPASTAPLATQPALVVGISPNTAAVKTAAPVNANATLSARQSVTGTETSLAAPANAVAAIVECESGNSDNLRWGFSNSATAILSTTLGMLCEPGRSENIPVGAGTYFHMIAVTTASADYTNVQWVLSQ